MTLSMLLIHRETSECRVLLEGTIDRPSRDTTATPVLLRDTCAEKVGISDEIRPQQTLDVTKIGAQVDDRDMSRCPTGNAVNLRLHSVHYFILDFRQV